MEVLSRRGVRMVPALESHQMVLHTACMRPVSSDGEPILGKVPGKDRVFLATGTGGKGVLMGPVIGKAISDLVIQGQTDLPISITISSLKILRVLSASAIRNCWI